MMIQDVEIADCQSCGKTRLCRVIRDFEHQLTNYKICGACLQVMCMKESSGVLVG